MVIQNQERVIALLNEINEVKGNFIDNETANQLTPELKAVWDEIFVCKNEIELILRSKTSMAGKGFFGVFGDVTVAAYLWQSHLIAAHTPHIQFEKMQE